MITRAQRAVAAWTVGACSLATAVAAYRIRSMRGAQWEDTLIDSGCRVVPPLPEVTAVSALGLGAGTVAVLCFAAARRLHTRQAGRAERLAWITSSAFCVIAAGAVAVGLFLLLSAPADPYGGVDGSGLPCGGG